MRSNNPPLKSAISEATDGRPATKTAPDPFASVEAAEAAGWKFDPAHGRWEAPPKHARQLKRLEKFAKSLYTIVKIRTVETSVDAPGEETRPVPSDNASNGDEKIGVLGFKGCHSCGQFAAAGKRLLRCGRCRSVSYCNAECQKLNWSSHKGFCNELASRQFDDIMAWYESVPKLAEKVVCLAWLNRKESPFVKVQGGVSARLAKPNWYLAQCGLRLVSVIEN